MAYTLELQDIGMADKSWAGEKAALLGELIRHGFGVPRGVCIKANAYTATVTTHHLDAAIAERIAKTEIDDPVELEAAAEEIRNWIEQAPLPLGFVQEVETAVGALGSDAGLYAVRASRVVEDVINPRASGLEQAFLGVVGTGAVLEHIRKCWGTPWSSRAIYYRHRKKMDPRQVTLAVVVQPMVQADAAGVLFTADPMTQAPDDIHIDATWGLGEAVIAARWRPDHYVVGKRDRTIRRREIATKSVMEIAGREGGLETIAVAATDQYRACLNDDQLLALAEIGAQVETCFSQLQDLEWSLRADRILLLQTRPLGTR